MAKRALEMSDVLGIYEDALDVMEEFCAKVESGNARSRDTYAKCVAILERAGRR